MELNQQIGKTIKALRLRNKMTLAECGEALGLSSSFISQIERGKSSISIETLYSIAQYFSVSISAFFPEPPQEEAAIIVRKYQPQGERMEGGRIVKALTDPGAGMNIQPSLLTLMTQEAPRRMEEAENDVCLYVIEGILALQLEENRETLYPSDSAYILRGRKYSFWNLSQHMTRILKIEQKHREGGGAG